MEANATPETYYGSDYEEGPFYEVAGTSLDEAAEEHASVNGVAGGETFYIGWGTEKNPEYDPDEPFDAEHNPEFFILSWVAYEVAEDEESVRRVEEN